MVYYQDGMIIYNDMYNNRYEDMIDRYKIYPSDGIVVVESESI